DRPPRTPLLLFAPLRLCARIFRARGSREAKRVAHRPSRRAKPREHFSSEFSNNFSRKDAKPQRTEPGGGAGPETTKRRSLRFGVSFVVVGPWMAPNGSIR